jgi:hypothetical protein
MSSGVRSNGICQDFSKVKVVDLAVGVAVVQTAFVQSPLSFSPFFFGLGLTNGFVLQMGLVLLIAEVVNVVEFVKEVVLEL